MSRIASLAAVLIAALFVGASAGAAAPTLKLSTYARARLAFHTRLTHQGPAPQEGEPLTTPPGAVRVPFGPKHELAAFVSKIPSDGKLRPAVVFLHGGFAWGLEDWQMIEAYRQAGYVTMMPVLRGENGQPGSFSFFYDEVGDVIAATETLAKIPGIDASRIFLAGHSAGGTLALLTSQASPRIRATASFSGSPDQFEFIAGYAELAPFDRADPRELAMRSPSEFATSFIAPVRVYYGAEEAWFARKSRSLADRAASAGLDVLAVPVAGGHASAVPEEIRLSIEFFKTFSRSPAL